MALKSPVVESLVSPQQPEPHIHPLISFRATTKNYVLKQRGSKKTSFNAVDGVNTDIYPRQAVSILGESGSEESTTAKMILDLESLSGREVSYLGKELRSLTRAKYRDYRTSVQAVFQNPYPSVDARFTVARALTEPIETNRIGSVLSRKARVEELLDHVAPPLEVLRARPAELSGGQLQRVATARALALQSKVLVLDEAVSALDVLVQKQILDLLVDLPHRLGLSYLFVSHDHGVVQLISHYVHIIQSGKVVESGPLEQVFDSPRHDYTRRLLAQFPNRPPCAHNEGV